MTRSSKVGLTVVLLAALLAVLVAVGGGVGSVELVILLALLAGGLVAIWRPRWRRGRSDRR
jgi:hypothetical protein